MNPESFFECHPRQWLRQQVRQQTLGPTVAVTIEQCDPDATPTDLCTSWRQWLDELLGLPNQTHILDNSAALSYLARYQGPVTVRAFFDHGTTSFTNLELVGKQGHISWHPSSHPLMLITGVRETHICCEHPYTQSLQEEDRS